MARCFQQRFCAAIDPEAGQRTEDLRDRLEELRDALLANDLPGANELMPKVEAAYRRCRDAYSSRANSEPQVREVAGH